MRENDRDTSTDAGSVVQAPFLRFRWAFLLIALSPIAFLFDSQAVLFVNPDSPQPFWDEFAHGVEAWSTRLMLLTLITGAAFSLSFSALRQKRQAFLTGVLGWFMAETIVTLLKRLVGRPRPLHPDSALDLLRPLYDRPDLKSFPSGHATAAVLFAVFVTFSCRSWLLRLLVWFVAALVLLDRLYMGAHFLSDVLFGAGLGWAALVLAQRLVAMSHIPLAKTDKPQRWRFLWLFLWGLIGSSVVAAPMEWKDALTGVTLDQFRSAGQPLWQVLLEPLYGPAMKLASLPDLKSFALRSLIWVALIAGFSLWRLRRPALPYLVSGVIIASLWVGIALSGQAGKGGAPKARDGREFLKVDLQSHIGDPVDGGMDLDTGLQRFRRLGFDLVVPTWHNSWSQGQDLRARPARPMNIFGAEWSRGKPEDSPLHLLVFNRSPQPHDLAGIDDWRELIRRVKEAGGVVLASHFWRGDSSAMPSADDLVAAGISGFEVAGRNQELRPEALERLEEIRSLCRRHELVASASGDFHGRRSFNYCWNLIEKPSGSAEVELWNALSVSPGSILPLVQESQLDRDKGVFLPLAVAWSYLRELGILARGVWVVWCVSLALLLLIRGRIQRSRAVAAL